MKDTFYFSHDYNTRNDEKINKLIRKHGVEGYGLYWIIIEDLYQNANALQLDCDGIAYDNRVCEKLVESLLKDFNLFVIKGDRFSCKAVGERLSKREEKSAVGRENAMKRWGKKNANPLQDGCKPNALKERKGKERKIKEDFFKKNINTQLQKYIERELPLYLVMNPFKKVTNSLLEVMKQKYEENI